MPLTVWHYELDTLPRIAAPASGSDGRFDIRIPIGVYPVTNDRVNVTIEFSIDDAPTQRIGFNTNNPSGAICTITDDLIGCIRRQDATAARPYLDMEPPLISKTNLYYEGTLNDVPRGAKLCYRAVVYPKNGVSSATPWYTLYATDPRFAYDDIRYIGPAEDQATRTNVVYYQADAKFHHLRVDYADISGARPDFRLRVNDRYTFSLVDPTASDWLPIVNPFHDYVVLSIPKSLVPRIDSCLWQGQPLDLGAVVNRARARIMFIHFCIQGLNDLFESPNKNYQPYRTYMQTTMRDELSTYSSRPNSSEGGDRDGYAFTLEDHRRYGLKYLWTFNAGVLALIAHDCPDDLARIVQDIGDGVMDPTIAGFGAHRLPYYQEETNRYAIQYGIDMMRNILGAVNQVYYLDQRLYKQIPNVMEAFRRARTVRYLVVDGSTGFDPHRASIRPNANASGLYLDHQYLWQDQRTGLYILYIDDEMRQAMLGSRDVEFQRGKLAAGLRQKLLYFAAHSSLRDKHLLIYSDDADKASGNGWFDGTYSGREVDFCDMYQAALEWIADHPWIEAVSSTDLDPATDCVGTIDLLDAIDPSTDPGGSLSLDVYGKWIHFDAWYDNWKDFRAVWLGQSLEEVSQSVEYAILDVPVRFRNELYQLAQMSFAMALHESQWNKQPLEPVYGLDPNQRADVVEPEDFVIASTLQIRNAQVYANAAVWAEWAMDVAGGNDEVHCNAGPVIDAIRGLRYVVDGSRDPAYSGAAIDATGLHWDRDPLANVILYNRSTLLVMDRNGGRITHIFTIKNGRPYCVSGTMKAYQYLTDEKRVGDNVTCDGEVLQNTVYTPNHAYVACDVREAAGVVGKKYNPKTTVQQDLDCFYPDNFNAYEYRQVDAQTVEWAYVHSDFELPDPLGLAAFRGLLAVDRDEKLAGRQGVVFHPRPGFRKSIRLDGTTVQIRYSGAAADHVTANEFCVDLYSGLMRAAWCTRRTPDQRTIHLASADGGLTVTVRLGNNCQFSAATLEGPANLRLHRALTDCIEVESSQGGDFAYALAW